MMALNRYRLKHLSRKGYKTAQRVAQLLERPDRLIGVILIGNTFANVLASSITTVIAIHYFGHLGVFLATIGLTLIILIFAEAAPKTLAALHPQRVAFPASRPLRYLLYVFYPLVWLINMIANSFLRLFGVKVQNHILEPLTIEELRTVVREATGKITSIHQQMLLRVLNSGQMTVEDVMVPRNQITGIDIDDNWEHILALITTTEHNYLLVYRENIDHVLGILNTRSLIGILSHRQLSKAVVLEQVKEVYFISEVTLLSSQLLDFQKEHKRIAVVVDEYGDIQGLLTLHDIIKEMVGEFAVNVDVSEQLIIKQNDGSYLVDGRVTLRDLNRITAWYLPVVGPKTLSGSIIEYLEAIPDTPICLRFFGYPVEIIRMSGNRIRLIQIWPEKWVSDHSKKEKLDLSS